MKRILIPFVVLIMGMMAVTSCLNSDDDYVYYDDTAITSFTLGTLNIVVDTTTAAGEDSTYTTTRDCSSYKFNIDQQRCEIYNTDSLPRGIVASKVVCTMYSKNSGYIGIKSLTSDSIVYYSSSDSIDFTKPREVYVYSNSGKTNRKYTITVNVHNEDADSLYWKQMGANTEFTKLTKMRTVALNEKLFVFGTDGSQTYAYGSNDGSTWTSLTQKFNHTLSADAYKSVVTKDNYLYIYDNGQVMRSTDGTSWSVVSNVALRQLVAASTTRLYAYDNNGQLMKSSDDGQTWSTATIDDSSSLLPTEDITYTCIPSKTNEDTYQLLLVGNRDYNTYASDTTASVWGKIEETLSDSQDQPWSYYNMSAENMFKAPRLRDIQSFVYDGVVVAIGEESLGGETRTPFDRIYSSADGGITWKKSTTLSLPAAFDTSTTTFAVTSDSNNFIWLICGKNGQVWRGRINRLGWTTPSTSFLE